MGENRVFPRCTCAMRVFEQFASLNWHDLFKSRYRGSQRVGDSPGIGTSKSRALLAHFAHKNITASSTRRTMPLALGTLAQTKAYLISMRLGLPFRTPPARSNLPLSPNHRLSRASDRANTSGKLVRMPKHFCHLLMLYSVDHQKN